MASLIDEDISMISSIYIEEVIYEYIILIDQTNMITSLMKPLQLMKKQKQQ